MRIKRDEYIMDKKQEQMLQAYKKTNLYNSSQLECLCTAMSSGLDTDKIEVMSNPRFSAMEMEQIYLGFLSGLTVAEV